ncbi:fibroblast growth factor 1-like [Montipora capricornis]|uniref:fibroblast growth factor 1-like n=1 Tax=Montipora foliosa TaxID=591990 RepID=UPI0035F132BF
MSSTRGTIVLFFCWVLISARVLCVISDPVHGRSVCPLAGLHHRHFNESLPLRINYEIFQVASKGPSHVEIVQLFCKTGYFLALDVSARKNRVVGTVNQSSENTFFEFQSFGTSIVRLRNLATGRFLAINSNGRVVTQAKTCDDSIFQTIYEENYFHTFTSHKYFRYKHHDLFLGIKQNGRCKSPKLTIPGQISVQFILLPNNNTKEKIKLISRAKQRLGRGQRDIN